jgi:hypothetical protein
MSRLFRFFSSRSRRRFWRLKGADEQIGETRGKNRDKKGEKILVREILGKLERKRIQKSKNNELKRKKTRIIAINSQKKKGKKRNREKEE